MAAKINDAAWLAGITANQTPVLLKRYRNEFPAETANLGVIQRVLLMTPENIHLNSFMYEPILDMSDHHLRRLYSEVVAMAYMLIAADRLRTDERRLRLLIADARKAAGGWPSHRSLLKVLQCNQFYPPVPHSPLLCRPWTLPEQRASKALSPGCSRI